MFIFQQRTFLPQNLTRNLKIMGPQPENHLPRRYDVILNDVIFQLFVQTLAWKIKFWFTFTHLYVPLLISNTIFWYINYDAKVLEYSPEDNLWRHIGKMENFGDIWRIFTYVSSVSLNLIRILQENFTAS